MSASDDDPRSQAEKRRVMLQDADVRNQSRNGDTGTYLSHTHSELGGRFALTEHQTITGVASPQPPALPASSPWSGAQPEPPIEPPLGIAINRLTPYELEPSLTSLPSAQPGAPAADGASSSDRRLPAADDVEPAGTGAPALSKDQTND